VDGFLIALALLGAASWVLALAGYRPRKAFLLLCLVPACISLLTVEWLADVSMVQLRTLAGDAEPMLGLAALLVADAVPAGLGAAARLREGFGEELRGWERGVSHWPGGIVVLPVLLVQVQAFHLSAAVSFALLALWVGVGLAGAFALAALAVRRLLPEPELLQELRILLVGFQVVGVVTLSVLHTRLPVTAEVARWDGRGFLALLVLAVAVGAFGALRRGRRPAGSPRKHQTHPYTAPRRAS